MVDLETALEQQLLDVAVAQRITQVPRNRLDDQPGLEMAALESSLERRFSLAAMALRIMDASGREAANSVAVANEPLTSEVCDRPRHCQARGRRADRGL